MQRNVIVATIAALMLGAVGCGSSGPLTAAELTRQANTICKQRTATIAVLRKKHPRDFRALIVAGIPVEEKAINDLAKLKPPASAKADYERFVAIQRNFVTQLKRAAAGKRATGGNPRQGEELTRIEGKLGLSACQ